MAFEVFQETGTRNREFISVTETKAFGLSRAFLNKHDITTAHKAVILYDPDTRQVALHFSLNDPRFGFSVRIPNKKHGGTIIARSFFDLKGINPKDYAGRYGDFKIVPLRELGQDQRGDAFVITLKEQQPESEPEAVSTPAAARRMDDVIIEDIGDEPINLDDIPF